MLFYITTPKTPAVCVFTTCSEWIFVFIQVWLSVVVGSPTEPRRALQGVGQVVGCYRLNDDIHILFSKGNVI